MSIRRRYHCALILFIVVLPLAGVLILLYRPQSDALWRIVSQQCLPHQRTTGVATPCVRLNPQQGYLLLKDRNGVLQYLLLPTRRNRGIDDPQLLNPATPNYLAAAWYNRDLLSQHYGAIIPDRHLSLTVNSRYGRSQDQLHIHLSCTRQAIVTRLWRIYPTLDTQWRRIEDIEGKRYWARRLSNATLARTSPFILLAQLAGTPDAMADYGLALLPAPDGQLILLATRRALWRGNLASIESIQDHRCPQLYPQRAGTP